MPEKDLFFKESVTARCAAYLKAGIGTSNFPDDSSGVNVPALPIRGIELGMLLLNLGVWLYAAAEVAGTVMPSGSLPAPMP